MLSGYLRLSGIVGRPVGRCSGHPLGLPGDRQHVNIFLPQKLAFSRMPVLDNASACDACEIAAPKDRLFAERFGGKIDKSFASDLACDKI